MGMKCNFIVASKSDPAEVLRNLPQLDVAASDALATTILGKRSWGRKRRAHRTGDLVRDVYPRDGEVAVAVYGDTIIAAFDDALEWPGEAVDDWGWKLIDSHDVDAFVLHSVVGMGCFASWRRGRLVRSFGGASDDGVIMDEGRRLAFERGLDAEDDGFGSITQRAILDRLGFCYEGPATTDAFRPEAVPLLVYR